MSPNDRHDQAPRKTQKALRRLAPGLAPLILLGCLFTLSCRLSITTTARATFSGPGPSVAARLFGDAGAAIGGSLYERADLYFHRGIGHARDTAFSDTLFQRLQHKVSPSGHVHVKGHGIKEIMPWLWLTMKLDAKNVEPYLVAAFWLAGAIDRPGQALDVLRKAQQELPLNYEVQIAKGRIHLKQGNLAQAGKAFDAALAFWPGSRNPEDRTTRQDRAEALLYRALLHEAQAEPHQAAGKLRDILSMFPERTTLQTRIEHLEQGTQPEVLAESRWNSMLQSYASRQAACPHGDNEAEPGGHEPHEHPDDNEPHVH